MVAHSPQSIRDRKGLVEVAGATLDGRKLLCPRMSRYSSNGRTPRCATATLQILCGETEGSLSNPRDRFAVLTNPGTGNPLAERADGGHLRRRVPGNGRIFSSKNRSDNSLAITGGFPVSRQCGPDKPFATAWDITASIWLCSTAKPSAWICSQYDD